MEENNPTNTPNANEKVRQILDAAFYTFSVEAMDDSGRQPSSKAEVEAVKDLMAQARKLDPTDPELLNEIAQYEAICDEAYERRFVGFKWLMIIVAAFAAFFVYDGCSSLKTKKTYTVEMAAKNYDMEVTRVEKYLTEMATAPDSVLKARKKYIKKQEKRSKELAEMDADKYLKEMKKRANRNAFGSFRTAIFWFIMVGLYYKATLAPVFLINKRQRQMHVIMTGAGWLKKLIFFLLGLFIALPVTEDYKIVDRSTGSVVGGGTDISPLLIIKIMGIVIIAMFLLMMALIGLPILTLVGYLRNYQYEKVDEFFDKAMQTIKGWAGMNKPVAA
ncbi:MAG: hypothetical protein CVU09_08175 [Bacteroidetes bacterium HGW-Bacteroidetes-4]|jgi:cation transport ATPase|nr:MAG: hypothetical protein CVU09_08175 [Bacteroidetes bacterium HGW-Bacteroidetes-4]